MPSTTRRFPIALTERDLRLLRGLFECRVMTLAHAAVFHFSGSVDAATKRVQKLKAAGILAERPRRVYQPSILFLTKRAFALLEDRGALAKYPRIGRATIQKRARVSELTLRHELAVMDARAAFHKALAVGGQYALVEFCTWPLLCQFRAAPGIAKPDILVRPDGFIRIRDTLGGAGAAEQRFFFELDRGTETQATLAAKAACYGDFYRRGGMAARYGRPPSEYKQFPFRVLIVCRNAERRNNACRRMLLNRPPALTQAWLTTFDELLADPLGPIWVQPVAYRDAVAGTDFDGHTAPPRQQYIRRVSREMLVHARVRKTRLFG